jgi:cell division protein FtsI (penicillin-binding protein 3)
MPAIDSVLYNSIGMKNDLNAIFTFMNIGYNDSIKGGYWRTMQLKNNNANLKSPLHTSDSKKITPDVVGMGLKDAVYLLENKGLKVEISGRGKVANQSLVVGTTFNKGQKISLLLN